MYDQFQLVFTVCAGTRASVTSAEGQGSDMFPRAHLAGLR